MARLAKFERKLNVCENPDLIAAEALRNEICACLNDSSCGVAGIPQGDEN